MSLVGIKTGHEFTKNKEGEQIVVMLQVQISEAEDVQTVELFTQAGDEVIPPDGSEIIITELSQGWKIGIASKDSIEPTIQAGERKAYSTDPNGAIAAFINFLNTGVLELNGNTNFAVKFNELETAFNQLKTDFDNHVHSGVTVGAGSTAITTPSTADITPAKSTEVLL